MEGDFDHLGRYYDDSRIYVIGSDGKDLHGVPADPTAHDVRWWIQPSWSPDSRLVAYAGQVASWADGSRGSGPLHIYVSTVDGTETKQLTFSDHSDYKPLWTPDGERIVFLRTLVGKRGTGDDVWDHWDQWPHQVWIMNADGSDPQLLAELPVRNPEKGGTRGWMNGPRELFRWAPTVGSYETDPHLVVETQDQIMLLGLDGQLESFEFMTEIMNLSGLDSPIPVDPSDCPCGLDEWAWGWTVKRGSTPVADAPTTTTTDSTKSACSQAMKEVDRVLETTNNDVFDRAFRKTLQVCVDGDTWWDAASEYGGGIRGMLEAGCILNSNTAVCRNL
jgi:hypothetical protein